MKQRRKKDEEEYEKNMLSAKLKMEKEQRRVELLEAQKKKKHWPSIGLFDGRSTIGRRLWRRRRRRRAYYARTRPLCSTD